MSELLSEQELKDKIDAILFSLTDISPFNFSDSEALNNFYEEMYIQREYALQEIIKISDDQKIAHADKLIGKDEELLNIPVVDNTGAKIYRIEGASYTPIMVARNLLRAEQRKGNK